MKSFESYKKEREVLKRHSAQAIDAKRAKLTFDDRNIKGYAIVFGSKNDYDEVVLKGACTNSLNARGVGSNAGNKITILNQHNQRQPLCLPSVLIEDDYGLYFEAEINEGVSYCNDVIASIRQGTLSQLSYGFDYVWDKTEYDQALDAYVLKEIKLWEISLVTFSSDPSAQLRSYCESQLAERLIRFTDEDINDLQELFLLKRAATSTQVEEETKEYLFNELLKIF